MSSRLGLAVVAAFLTCSLAGCTVLTVAAVAADVAATSAGLAVDAAVGTAKVVGSVAGAMVPESDK